MQQGFDTLQALEQERITALLKSGDTLAAAYCSAIQGLPAAAEGLKETLTGLHSTGEVGVQHLAQVAAGGTAAWVNRQLHNMQLYGVVMGWYTWLSFC